MAELLALTRRNASRVDVEDILRRFELAKSDRKNWDSHCTEVAERMWPEADDFLKKRSQGEKRRQEVVDSTAARALGKFGAAMESLLIPRQQIWHRLRASDERLNQDPSVKAWFEELNRVLFQARSSPRANYYGEMHVGFLSLGAFGASALFVDEALRGGMRYRNCHAGQIWIAVDHEGKVDTIYRCYPMTAKAAWQKWGERTPEKVRAALAIDPWKNFDFLHAVRPRKDRDPEALDAQAMRFESHYIGVEDRTVISSGGYEELPYMYGRWMVSPGEIYPRSPAMTVLPNQKVLNQQKKTLLRAGHNAVDPPLLFHSDGIFGAGSKAPQIQAGGPIFGAITSDGRPLVQPLVTGARLEQMKDLMDIERDDINDAFLVNLFRILIEDPRSSVTATEIMQRVQEKGELIAPAVGRQQSELLGPQIEREVAILMRQGAVPPLPPILLEAQGDYTIEYDSPATQFQRAGEITGVARTLEVAAPLITLDPTLAGVIKGDAFIRHSLEIQGVPSKLVRTAEEFAEYQAQLAEAQQAAIAPEQAATGAGALKDGAQALQLLQGGGASAA